MEFQAKVSYTIFHTSQRFFLKSLYFLNHLCPFTYYKDGPLVKAKLPEQLVDPQGIQQLGLYLAVGIFHS